GKRLARELPDARLRVYPDCGHIPMVEARRPTTRDLISFLGAERTPEDTPELPATVPAIELPPLHAADVALLGAELAPRKFAAPNERTSLDVAGQLRVRGETLYNLDLDRGLDPS